MASTTEVTHDPRDRRGNIRRIPFRLFRGDPTLQLWEVDEMSTSTPVSSVNRSSSRKGCVPDTLISGGWATNIVTRVPASWGRGSRRTPGGGGTGVIGSAAMSGRERRREVKHRPEPRYRRHSSAGDQRRGSWNAWRSRAA